MRAAWGWMLVFGGAYPAGCSSAVAPSDGGGADHAQDAVDATGLDTVVPGSDAGPRADGPAAEPDGCSAEAPATAPTCGASVCGNGAIDRCQFGQRQDVEQCDGEDLGGASCASLGFSGGTLRCGATCWFDTSACGDCGSDPSFTACATPPLGARAPGSIALATRAGEIGVVWTTRTSSGSQAGFARLGPDLALRASSPCLDPGATGPIALAATPSGWVVAVERAPDLPIDSAVDVLTLDALGAMLATRTIAAAQTPGLIARPDDGPLLLFNDARADRNTSPINTVLRGELLGGDGAVVAGPAELLAVVTQGDIPSGVFLGDAFLVAQATTSVQPSYGIQLARVGLDLATAPAASIAASQSGGSQFARQGDGVLMTYAAFYQDGSGSQPGTFWQRVDATGALVGSPVLLPPLGGFTSVPIVPAGGGSLIAEADVPGSSERGVKLLRLDASGAPVGTALRADHDPYPRGAALALLGTTAVVAWASTPEGITATPGLSLATLPASP